MMLIQSGLVILSGFPILATAALAYQIMRNGQGAFGNPTINPTLFYPAKIIAAIGFIFLFFASLNADLFQHFPWLIQDEIVDVQKLLALIFLLGGNLLLIPAYYTMSIFTRVGLPTKPHALQTTGVYKISRNPMYASFLFFFVACFLLIPSVFLALLLIFCLIAHHFIIKNEEHFLASEFGDDYLTYKKNTARYL